MVVDFSYCEENHLRAYAGRNGNKRCLIYHGDMYMFKFHTHRKNREDLSYTNDFISEHLGCQIFNSVGFEAQETILGMYNGRPGVACKDFAVNGFTLLEANKLKNAYGFERVGKGENYDEMMLLINEQKIIPKEQLKDKFWDMFVVDALVGNFDRHSGNWGFLVNEKTKETRFAPIYDCGSCLFPAANALIINKVLNDENELKMRVYGFPNSALRIGEEGKESKINYFDYISSLQNEDCNAALKRIVPLIDMKKINSIIDSVDMISDKQKEFYSLMVGSRKALILDYSLSLLNDRERNENYKMVKEGLDEYFAKRQARSMENPHWPKL